MKLLPLFIIGLVQGFSVDSRNVSLYESCIGNESLFKNSTIKYGDDDDGDSGYSDQSSDDSGGSDKKPPAKKARNSTGDDDDDDDDDEALGDSQRLTILNSLPSNVVYTDKIRKMNKCDLPSTYDLLRADGVALTAAKMERIVIMAVQASRALNNVPNIQFPDHAYIVHIDPITELIFDISMVSLYRYNVVQSVYEEALTRFGLCNMYEELKYCLHRQYFYKEEKKAPQDTGLYYHQDDSDKAIKRAANYLCVPEITLGFQASIESYFRGPQGMIIKRPEEAGTHLHIEDTSLSTATGYKYRHIIDEEWILEFNRVVPQREIDLGNTEHIVIIEDEGK